MKKWEYLMTDTWTLQEMNMLGEEGWELVFSDKYHLYWKREIQIPQR